MNSAHLFFGNPWGLFKHFGVILPYMLLPKQGNACLEEAWLLDLRINRLSSSLTLTVDIWILQLELAKLAGKCRKELSPIYVSLAITYFDLKCPADAINCYMEELEIMEERDYKEVRFYFHTCSECHLFSPRDLMPSPIKNFYLVTYTFI